LRSPFSTNATIDGVVRLPSLLGITTGSLPSITETQELVVPRSIPIILLIFLYFLVYFILTILLFQSLCHWILGEIMSQKGRGYVFL
jgi:hypothetical protein